MDILNMRYYFIILFFTFLGQSYGQAHVRGRNIITTVPLAYSFNASSLSNGSIASNSVSASFVNTAAVKSTSSGWPQIDPTDDADWVLETTASRRDQTVNTYIKRGTVFLRVQNDGRAIYVYHNSEAANGYMEIGVVTGNINNGATINEYTGVPLWKSQDLISLLGSNYTRNEAADSITISAIGFEVNIKYNGADIPGFRVTDFRIPMGAGKTGIKAASNSGVRFFNVNHPTNSFLFSDYAKKTVDVRDFGWKTGTTTGTIVGGTNQVTVTALNGLGAGDYILIPTGYENTFNGRSGGTRGTKGVGNTFPSQSYTSTAAMNADLSKPDGTYAWLETTGETFRYSSSTSTWSKPTGNLDYYYSGMAIPIAFRAQIVAINGLVLTVARTAAVTATNAPVYFDNSFILNKLGADPSFDKFPYKYPVPDGDYRPVTAITDTGWTISVPLGTYAIGENVAFIGRSYLNFKGASKTGTVIFSPDGTPSAEIRRNSSGYSTNENYKLVGNVRDNGFGWKWWFWDSAAYSAYTPKDVLVFSSTYYGYGHPITGSPYCVYKNIQIDDAWAGGVTGEYSDNLLIDSCIGTKTQGTHFYIGWYFQSSHSSNVLMTNCNFTSSRAEGAFESFSGYNTIFRNCHSINGYWSSNTSRYPRIEIDSLGNHCSATFTANSITDWVSPLQPIVNFNNNLGNTSGGTGAGGYVEGFDMVVTYQDANNDMFHGISIQPEIDSVTIKNCSYTGPDWIGPSAQPGPQGIRSVGTHVFVDGFTCTGITNNEYFGGNSIYNTNIGVQYGTVKNCVANKFAVGTAVTLLNNTGTAVTF